VGKKIVLVDKKMIVKMRVGEEVKKKGFKIKMRIVWAVNNQEKIFNFLEKMFWCLQIKI
jgi:hypothetical protein